MTEFTNQQAILFAREHCVESAYRCAHEMAEDSKFATIPSREIARIVCSGYKLAEFIEDGIARDVARLRKYEERGL